MLECRTRVNHNKAVACWGSQVTRVIGWWDEDRFRRALCASVRLESLLLNWHIFCINRKNPLARSSIRLDPPRDRDRGLRGGSKDDLETLAGTARQLRVLV